MLVIYVPAPGHPALAGIAPGSGIVGSPERLVGRGGPDIELVTIDYEGNLYGASNVRTWADRVLVAEGRQRVWYPTVARRVVPSEALVRVGTLHIHDDESEFTMPQLWVENHQPLADWLGLDVESDEFKNQLLRSR